MPKTILVITDNVQDQVNGVVTTFKNLEDHAGRNGYRVVYLDPGQFPNCACPGYPEVRLCWPHGISKKIKAIQPDYIHIATEGPVGLFARWWCERNAIPYNTSYHTKFPEFLNKLYGVPVAWTYWYMRWFHRHSERVLVTTLTKKTAEDLAEYLQSTGLKCRYLHSDIDAIERVEILRQLRAATFDILIGINLLREGLDLPEVSLVCILDADKEGFLRNETSLIQTAGRAARHVNGECVLFADVVTDSIQALINVTEYRRARQIAHNEAHGITPQSVKRAVQQSLHTYEKGRQHADKLNASLVAEDETSYDKLRVLSELEEEMRVAASKLEFERAGLIRDQIAQLKSGPAQLSQKHQKYSRKKGKS